MKKLMMLYAAVTILAIVAFAGCKTNPQSVVTTAYQSEYSAYSAVSAAMTGWGNYVAQYHPPVQQEITVRNAFDAFQKADIAATEATMAYANATGSNSVAAAQNFQTASSQASAALGNLLGLVAQLTTNTNTPTK